MHSAKRFQSRNIETDISKRQPENVGIVFNRESCSLCVVSNQFAALEVPRAAKSRNKRHKARMAVLLQQGGTRGTRRLPSRVHKSAADSQRVTGEFEIYRGLRIR